MDARISIVCGGLVAERASLELMMRACQDLVGQSCSDKTYTIQAGHPEKYM